MELISQLLRTDFREFCVTYFVLRQINDIFTMAGIKRGSIPPDRMISGQRRTLVEEYYASTNWERQEDAEQFLKVLGYAIAQQYSGSDEPRQKLRIFCEREGLLVDGIHVSFRSNAAKIPKHAVVGSATRAKTADMKMDSAKSTEPYSDNFYLYADSGSDPTLSSGTVFHRVAGEQSAQILCRLFQKEYHAGDNNPSFFLKAADEVEPDGQILLDEALDWLDIYDDPDRFVYDPPPSKETMIRAQYSQRARKWEAVIMTRTNEANTVSKPETDQTTEKAHDRLRRVWVVHGRDERLRRGVFTFLRSLGLEPLEFSEARQLTKKPSPYIAEILDIAFAHAQAVVVLLTPDDQVQLRPDLLNPNDPPHEGTLTGQARPNVIFEGGMAWVSHREQTLFVQIGSVKPFSDVSGLHILRLNNNTDKRQDFAHRLRDAGCPVNMSGADWHTAGDLAPRETGGGSQPEVPSSEASHPPGGDVYPTPGNQQDVSRGPATAAKAARITHPPLAFPQKSPLEGKARFRSSKDPLGIGEDIEAKLLHKPEPEIYLSEGPAIWMRVMPAYGPAKTLPNHYLQSPIIGLCMLPLMPSANPRRVTGEDGCGFCQVVDNSPKALAVAYVFNTGEIWVINAYLPHNYVELDESRFTKTLDECVSFLDKIGVTGPYNWEVGFEGIKGRRLVARNQEFGNQCVATNIEFQGTFNKGDNAVALLLPFFEDVFDKFRSKRPKP